MRDFLWQGNSKMGKIYLVAWVKVYTNLRRVELNIINIITMNKDMLVKLLWQVYFHHTSIWSKAIRSKYLDNDQVEWIFIMEDTHIGFMICNGLRKMQPLIFKFLKWIVITGAKIYLWYDTWLVDCPLYDITNLENLKYHLSKKWRELI